MDREQRRSLLDIYQKYLDRLEKVANEKHDQQLITLLNQFKGPWENNTEVFLNNLLDANKSLGDLSINLVNLAPTDQNAANLVKEFRIEITSPGSNIAPIPVFINDQ